MQGMGSKQTPDQTVTSIQFGDDSITPLGVSDAQESCLDAIIAGNFPNPEDSQSSTDRLDMTRMGRHQETRRIFREYSLLSFTCLVTSSWEYLMLSLSTGLENGGRAGLFWSYVWAMAGYAFLCASIAEMASMAPTAGGQYVWVSEWAPKRFQKILSYLTGWLSFTNWQAFNAFGFFTGASIVDSLISVYHPAYEPTAWKTVVYVTTFAIAVAGYGIWFRAVFPVVQNFAMIFHVLGFVIVIATLWVLAPHIPAKDVFLNFEGASGWSPVGLALMVGQLASQTALASPDAPVHMAEEVRDASMIVPKAIMNAFWLNATMALLTLITFLFCVPSVAAASADSLGQPFYYVLKLAWPTTGFVYVLCILFVLISFGNVAYTGATARVTFALARDGVLPLSKWLSSVSTRFRIPANAIVASSLISIMLSLVYLGSATAYNAVISIGTSAQMATYSISISCLLWKRLTSPEDLPRPRWSLGRYGVLYNAIAVVYTTQVCFWSFWPTQAHVNASSFNFAPVVFVGVLLVASVVYVFHGHKTYTAPVSLIRLVHNSVRMT